jgi:hypothetical protein
MLAKRRPGEEVELPGLSAWGHLVLGAWQSCFGLVNMSPAGGVLSFRWGDMEAKLKPLGLWTADIVKGLDIIERVVLDRFRPGAESFDAQAEELLESD